MLERPDPALAAWGAALRRDKKQRCRLLMGGVIAVTACAAMLATLVLPPRPRLAWNASASMPLGLYRVEPGRSVASGDLAVAALPAAMRSLADRRHYLPLGVPLIKDVAAVGGERICGTGDVVSIQGHPVALRRQIDRLGRGLPSWQGCRTLTHGSVLLLGRSPDSFDGRYFGPTGSRDLIGRAVPLWLW